ncbi:hypothetical protein [Lacrimispora sp.]|nr:hypothetical protein [Lacrimispora sp.]
MELLKGGSLSSFPKQLPEEGVRQIKTDIGRRNKKINGNIGGL